MHVPFYVLNNNVCGVLLISSTCIKVSVQCWSDMNAINKAFSALFAKNGTTLCYRKSHIGLLNILKVTYWLAKNALTSQGASPQIYSYALIKVRMM